jgi:hypothetical protein
MSRKLASSRPDAAKAPLGGLPPAARTFGPFTF